MGCLLFSSMLCRCKTCLYGSSTLLWLALLPRLPLLALLSSLSSGCSPPGGPDWLAPLGCGLKLPAQLDCERRAPEPLDGVGGRSLGRQ